LMSRIGKKPVELPSGVDVKLSGQNITVKGPKGELRWTHPEGVGISVESGQAVVTRKNDAKPVRAFHGLTRALLQNMVTGVSEGYTRVLELVGIGYRAQAQGDKLVLTVGYSHPVEFKLPEGIKAEVDKKQTTITLSGIDRQKLGQAAADIKAIRPPDSYKGKGVRYSGERLKLKAGKAAK
jgi:large subunit ribosomal protein L6